MADSMITDLKLFSETVKIPDYDQEGRDLSNVVLCDDIKWFSETAELPLDLDQFVSASKHDQIALYQEMSKTYSTTPLHAPANGTKFIWYSLHKIQPHGVDDAFLQGLLKYYELPDSSQVELALPPSYTNKRWMPQMFLLVLETLPVTSDQVTPEGVFNVYVEVNEIYLSSELLILVTEHRKARFDGDKNREQELLNQINATEDYKIVEIDERVLLTRKYRIRLRGMDGIEARDELLKIVNGKCLKIKVYDIDDKGCCIGDVYCDDILLQDKLLEKYAS